MRKGASKWNVSQSRTILIVFQSLEQRNYFYLSILYWILIKISVACGNYSGALYFLYLQLSRVERTLDVNTWLLIIILLLLALVLGKRVFKKVYSWLKATHLGDVQGTREEDQGRTVRTEEEFATDNTDIMNESALLLNFDDESPELNQQVCTAETKGACVHRGDLPFQVRQANIFFISNRTPRKVINLVKVFLLIRYN